jgi:hypothetical protein
VSDLTTSSGEPAAETGLATSGRGGRSRSGRAPDVGAAGGGTPFEGGFCPGDGLPVPAGVGAGGMGGFAQEPVVGLGEGPVAGLVGGLGAGAGAVVGVAGLGAGGGAAATEGAGFAACGGAEGGGVGVVLRDSGRIVGISALAMNSGVKASVLDTSGTSVKTARTVGPGSSSPAPGGGDGSAGGDRAGVDGGGGVEGGGSAQPATR